uniref:Uncharacterized protein n=1 Tax=Rhizochromulina marina TaxID=1034831 RepID=A0A7S2SVM2_9STRA|mmetsp:Transcript_9534/g.27031  ORF Transcript_9534/g.27031 Transcript_9534/m.27031 type:complete len:318 (+) Transcript_9534:110-1063(+)
MISGQEKPLPPGEQTAEAILERLRRENEERHARLEALHAQVQRQRAGLPGRDVASMHPHGHGEPSTGPGEEMTRRLKLGLRGQIRSIRQRREALLESTVANIGAQPQLESQLLLEKEMKGSAAQLKEAKAYLRQAIADEEGVLAHLMTMVEEHRLIGRSLDEALEHAFASRHTKPSNSGCAVPHQWDATQGQLGELTIRGQNLVLRRLLGEFLQSYFPAEEAQVATTDPRGPARVAAATDRVVEDPWTMDTLVTTLLRHAEQSDGDTYVRIDDSPRNRRLLQVLDSCGVADLPPREEEEGDEPTDVALAVRLVDFHR